jgi:8-oxo-dGTP pyrophosphatase MutT (NUDIX family)
MKTSAGTLLFRRRPAGLEVVIVQPSGIAAKYGWSVPKGLLDPGESLEAAARRETLEETGIEPGTLAELGHIDYVKSKKRVHVFYGEAPEDAEPRKASWEIAQARFVPIDEARALLHVDQRPLIDMLLARVP